MKHRSTVSIKHGNHSREDHAEANVWTTSRYVDFYFREYKRSYLDKGMEINLKTEYAHPSHQWCTSFPRSPAIVIRRHLFRLLFPTIRGRAKKNPRWPWSKRVKQARRVYTQYTVSYKSERDGWVSWRRKIRKVREMKVFAKRRIAGRVIDRILADWNWSPVNNLRGKGKDSLILLSF